MAKPPESTKTSLRQHLAARARERWPQLAGITIRWHGEFAYVAGQLPDGTTLPLMRLRYAGSAATWGFAIYRASHDDYDKSVELCQRSWTVSPGVDHAAVAAVWNSVSASAGVR